MAASSALKNRTSAAAIAVSQADFSDKLVAAHLRLAAIQSDDINIQLSVLGRALVLACMTNGIPRHVLTEQLDRLWLDAVELAPNVRGN